MTSLCGLVQQDKYNAILSGKLFVGNKKYKTVRNLTTSSRIVLFQNGKALCIFLIHLLLFIEMSHFVVRYTQYTTFELKYQENIFF